MPTTLPLAPPDFLTFLRPCSYYTVDISSTTYISRFVNNIVCERPFVKKGSRNNSISNFSFIKCIKSIWSTEVTEG